MTFFPRFFQIHFDWYYMQGLFVINWNLLQGHSDIPGLFAASLFFTIPEGISRKNSENV